MGYALDEKNPKFNEEAEQKHLGKKTLNLFLKKLMRVTKNKNWTNFKKS